MTMAMVAILVGFGLAAGVLVAVVLVVVGWRRSENEYERWQQQRGEDEHDGSQPPGSARSHWGGLGRPGQR